MAAREVGHEFLYSSIRLWLGQSTQTRPRWPSSDPLWMPLCCPTLRIATLYGNPPRPFSGIHNWSPRPFVVFRIDPLWVIGATHKGRNSDPLWAASATF